ncbi:hypothetical protein ACFL3B_02585 [Gemmatimonadota bacterium]
MLRVAVPLLVVGSWLTLFHNLPHAQTGIPSPRNSNQVATPVLEQLRGIPASISERQQRALGTVLFERVAEPREQAFTLLVPKGWQLRGGIVRVDPTRQGGPAQSIAAKIDFAVQSDGDGSVMIYWPPDMLYFDARHTPAGQMGLFQPGSNYQGMTVWPVLPAIQFLQELAFRSLHPQASGVQIEDQRNLLALAQRYLQRVRAFPIQTTFSYDAATTTVSYSEGGRRYREQMITVIENWGQMGAGMWGNKETIVFRAPADEFDRWLPILSIVQRSVQLNTQWLAGELRGQIQRGEIALQTQREINQINQQISDHQQTTTAEIHNDMFLTLTDQEEYVNPYSNEVEVGSNQWQHRWVNDRGDVIYSDREAYDPNTDVQLSVSGFRRSAVRRR